MLVEEKNSSNIWKSWPNSKKSDLIHNFTMANYDRASKKSFYGYSEACTPVESHLLEKICDNEGITVTELAREINRSKSAVSQIVKKLEKRDLITKTAQKDHEKKLSLKPTTKGKEFNEVHIKFDEKEAGEFFAMLSKDFDDDTMNNFFSVLNRFVESLKLKPKA